MNDYFDWAYSTYYFSTQTQSQSAPTPSRPTSERANDAKQIAAPAEPKVSAGR
jgi:hypothetical protein